MNSQSIISVTSSRILKNYFKTQYPVFMHDDHVNGSNTNRCFEYVCLLVTSGHKRLMWFCDFHAVLYQEGPTGQPALTSH